MSILDLILILILYDLKDILKPGAVLNDSPFS